MEPSRCAWEYVVTLDKPLWGGCSSDQTWPGRRVAVVGSRNFDLRIRVAWFIRHLDPGVTVVAGCAPGVDSSAMEEAVACGLETRLLAGTGDDGHLIHAEETGQFSRWVDSRWRGGRPIEVNESSSGELDRLWNPPVVYREIGSGKRWYGGPVTEAGWYAFGRSERKFTRPPGPFSNRQEAQEASRLEYFNVKYQLPHHRGW